MKKISFIHEQDGIKSPQLLLILCHKVDVDIVELFMNSPALHEMSYPVTVQNMQTYQAREVWLIQTSLSQPLLFSNKIINRRNLIFYHNNVQQQTNKWKIYIPQTLIGQVI